MYLNLGDGKYLNMDRVEEVRIGAGDNGPVAAVVIGGRNQYHRGAEAATIRRYLECDSACGQPPAPAVDEAAVRAVMANMLAYASICPLPSVESWADRLDAALAGKQD